MRLDPFSAFAADVADECTLTVRRLGHLRLAGRVGAADPLITSSVRPFVRAVPEGTWPVDVLLADRKGDARVALARVVFRDESPKSFELALCEGQDVRTLRDDERFGYGVDCGTGCFADPAAILDGTALLAALEKTYAPTWSWAVAGDASFIAFSSGYGDGIYSSYFGLDASGDPVCLLTDFGVIDLELPRHATDVAFRRAEAEARLSAFRALLPSIGENGHGDVWTAAQKLVSLTEDAAHVVPCLLDDLSLTHDEMRIDVLTFVVGGLASSTDGSLALAGAVDALPDDALAHVLDRRGEADAPPALAHALSRRWPRADNALRIGILRALSRDGDAPHESFAELAEDALGEDEELVATALRLAAAFALARTAAWSGRASKELRALAEDPTKDEGLRFAATGHLADPRVQCALYVMLGKQGAVAAPVQLGYLAQDATLRETILSALDDLATNAPNADVRDRAARTKSRLSAGT